MVFSASGREDSDTRMLGDGRPFYVQIENPIYYDISFEQFREIEKEVNKTNLCAVIKLKSVSPSELLKIKKGEEHKNKQYRALCHTTHPNLVDLLNILNEYNGRVLEISQQTPIRVIHRRVIDTRKKLIYSMKATLVPGK